MQAREEFVHRYRSGTFFSVLVLLLVFPIMGIGELLSDVVGPGPFSAALLATVALAGAFYLFYLTEAKLELDAQGVRLVEQDVAFGVRRAKRLLWEIPAAELTSVREVTTRTPSSRGGWIHSTLLHFPGERTLSDSAFGSKGVPGSEYNRLVQVLRERLGDAFTSEDRV